MDQLQKELLRRNARALTELPEGWISSDQPDFIHYDKQVRIRKSPCGYGVWTIMQKQTEDTPEIGKWMQISNFTLECINLERFVDRPDPIVQRQICITDETGGTLETYIVADEMNTLSNFTKWIESRGNYSFWGTGAHLTAIKNMAFPPSMPETAVKNIAGHDIKTNTWLFANGAIRDGKVYRADEETGAIIVPPNHKYKLIPADIDDEEGAAQLPQLGPFNDKVDIKYIVLDLIRDLTVLWGPQVELAVGWFLAALFRSRCLKDPTLKDFPLLFVSGPAKQGKSELVRVLMRMYGLRDYTAKSLGNLTETSIYTLLNVMCDIPVWYDEYKEDIIRGDKTFLREAVKNVYGALSRSVGTTDPFKTKSRRARTGLVLSGEMRPGDNALDSRCVNVDVRQNNQPELLKRVTLKDDMSNVVIHLLTHYEDYWPLIKDRMDVVFREFNSNPKIASRSAFCYSKVCAVLDCIVPDGERIERISKWLGGKIERNDETNVMSDMISKLPYMIQVQRTPIALRIDREKQRLSVHAAFMIQKYYESNRDLPVHKMDELIRLGRDARLLSSIHTDDKTVRAVVEGMDSNGIQVASQQRCFVFDMRHPIVEAAVEKLESKSAK